MADKTKDIEEEEATSAEEIQAEVIEEMGGVVVTDKKEVGRGGLRTIDPSFANGAQEVETFSNQPKK